MPKSLNSKKSPINSIVNSGRVSKRVRDSSLRTNTKNLRINTAQSLCQTGSASITPPESTSDPSLDAPTTSSNSKCCSCHRSNSFEIELSGNLKEISSQMKKMGTQMEKMAKHMAALEKSLANRKSKKMVRKIGSVTQDELLVFGLPAHSQEALNRLEDSLSDESYSRRIVSPGSTSICHMLR